MLGIGRSGAAAAHLLRSRDVAVYASDSSDSEATRKLAAELVSDGVTVDVGAHDLARIGRASLVVVSPGISPDAPAMVAAARAGREIVSEIELALRAAPSLRYIAITGTNGKTTTTALVGHMLRALGLDAPDAGNIGTPLSQVILERMPDIVALELSSFQLHDTPSVAPTVGVLTNLSPDHLDRYPNVEAYFADKALMFSNATTASTWVVNADDPESTRMTDGIVGTQLRFSLESRADAWLDRAAGRLDVYGAPLLHRSDLALLGDHNVANALAAALAVMAASPDYRTDSARTTLASALRDFRALSHRLEVVGEWNGVTWINDSKATNVGSTLVAVQGMTRPTILLLGGRHKGEPYTALIDPIREHVKHVIAFGEAAPIVVADLRRRGACRARRWQLRNRCRSSTEARSDGRCCPAVARVLQLRHVQQLRGAR